MICNIPIWAFVLIIIVVIIVGIWLVALLVTFTFKTIFKYKLKSESNAINMLLFERHEIMLDLIVIAETNNISLNESDKKAMTFLERIPDFQILSKADRDQRILSFVHSSYNIISKCERSSLRNNQEYVDKRKEYVDTEETYRQKSAGYNSDILGYNYWVNVPAIKWLFRLFKVKEKDLIV